MPDRQIDLFVPPRPLPERIREAVLLSPEKPGVYIMTGADGTPVYIGQSGNLRMRLGYYRNARPGRVPRKIARLLAGVESVSWEVCESAAEARARENALLRLHRPRFNRVNVFPEGRQCIGFKRSAAGAIELCRARKPEPGWSVYGVFKANTTGAFGALLRLLFAWSAAPASPHDFPARLFLANSPRAFRLTLEPAQAEYLMAQLHWFLGGKSPGLLEELRLALEKQTGGMGFLAKSAAEDLETLAAFFQSGAARNRALMQRYDLPGRLIRGCDLDDLLAVQGSPSDPQVGKGVADAVDDLDQPGM